MTRRYIYGLGLWVSLAASALTIASIIKPDWISWDSKSETGTPIRYTYGLHKRCSSLTGTCEHFPRYEDCQMDRTFCSMWRSVGFLMSFSVVVELAALVAYAAIILGGKQTRDHGWKVLCSLLIIAAAAECASMSIIAYLYDHDGRFFVGWRLDTSWVLCTVSWSLQTLAAVGIIMAAILLPEEGGYELIPDEHLVHG